MRRLALIAFMLLSLAGLAAAQIPTSGNVFVGYSFENSSSSTLNQDLSRPNLQGWEASLEGKIVPFLGVVADFSGHYGSQSSTVATPGGLVSETITGHETEVLFGPRVSVSLGKFRPFAEAEVGVARISNSNGFGSDTSFASAFGGGLDYRIFRPLAWRIQGDYVGTRFFDTTQSNLRLSTGIVIRF
jgi:opacity protein-like surface antigen